MKTRIEHIMCYQELFNAYYTRIYNQILFLCLHVCMYVCACVSGVCIMGFVSIHVKRQAKEVCKTNSSSSFLISAAGWEECACSLHSALQRGESAEVVKD